ncbi:hypothetical protein [Elizabethkingia sp. JS20170427COW]|uniref:hypothetical protein n=1 Tax=Elizabethkingia sp. JS20170427COW TaxID=2583851 RepID=UPI0011103913|nr:hypothetical protein [Elizabethkingia sp. JS20170427COW]QCX52348.1 hypothetical protein FGE20_00570 [Elizabethkingia sp. JS20170427COW]
MIENEILFKEKQKFQQWWIWLILLGVNLLFIVGAVIQIGMKRPFGNQPMSDTGFLWVTAFTIAVSILFLNFKLETRITKEGIYVRFFPFHLKFKYYSWREITKAYIRSYSPISDYGGWGIRLGLSGKGNAYNVSGNQGLQLEFADRKNLLIGTQKPEELSLLLEQLGR